LLVEIVDCPSVAELIDLKGVPSLAIVNRSGQLAWKGRYCAYDLTYFECFLQHTLSEALRVPCPIVDCELCNNDLSIDREINGSFFISLFIPVLQIIYTRLLKFCFFFIYF
jgi:hypothetical protein